MRCLYQGHPYSAGTHSVNYSWMVIIGIVFIRCSMAEYEFRIRRYVVLQRLCKMASNLEGCLGKFIPSFQLLLYFLCHLTTCASPTLQSGSRRTVQANVSKIQAYSKWRSIFPQKPLRLRQSSVPLTPMFFLVARNINSRWYRPLARPFPPNDRDNPTERDMILILSLSSPS